MTTCAYCDKETHETGRETDVCVALLLGHKIWKHTFSDGSGGRCELKHLKFNPATNPLIEPGDLFEVPTKRELKGYEPEYDHNEAPHYSTDDSVAIKELMRPCIIVCGENGYGILPADYLTNPPVKTVFTAQAKTIALALTHATLAAKGE